MTHYTDFKSPLGDIRVAADDGALRGIWFHGQKYFPAAEDWRYAPDDPLLAMAGEQLRDYFAGTRDRFDLPLAVGGTPFQKKIWAALRAIPYGDTLTYGALARRVESPRAVRAVGAAVGRNPLSILVPCHRVLGASGSLTGYAGGLDRKRSLLALEQRIIAGMARSYGSP